jgi:hypothetical protein
VVPENIESNYEKSGQEEKVVEFDKNKFWKTKYNRGHGVKGQQFLEVERGSMKMFLVSGQDCRDSDSSNKEMDLSRKHSS